MYTFENVDKRHQQKRELERNLKIFEAVTSDDCPFQLPLEGDEKPYTDVLAPNTARVKNDDDMHFSDEEGETKRVHWLRKSIFFWMAVVTVVLAIFLTFTLAVDVKEKKEIETLEKRNGGDIRQPFSKGEERYNRLFSQILDWGQTSRAVLEDVSSAPARALHWLAYQDPVLINALELGLGMEAIRSRFVLASLYFSTQKESFFGDDSLHSPTSWLNNTNWLSAFPVCQWYGVSCLEDEFGRQSLERVKSLNLSLNGLVGELPNELGLLELDIRTLDVSANSLKGTIPGSLTGLSNLNELYLGPNNFESTLPEKIFNLLHLTHLYINDCNLTGTIATDIGTLNKLQGLGLHNNKLSGKIPNLGNMTSIQALYLDGNTLTGEIPTTIGQLSTLVDLRLRQNQLSGPLPKELKNLRSLEVLYLDNNKLTGELPPQVFSSFRFIRDIQLYDNELDGTIPSEIGSLVALKILYLDGNKLTGHVNSHLGSLTTLESLFLQRNRLQGFLPSEIGRMTSLVNLRLYDNMFSGPLPIDLGKLTSLKTLLLQNCTFGGPIDKSLANLTSIETIHLHQNRFTGTMPPAVCSLDHIQDLTADCAGNPAEVSCVCCTQCYVD